MNQQITNFHDFPVAVTPVCDTNAYTAGDVLFDTTAIPIIATALPWGPIVGRVASVTVLDKDDQAAAGMTLFFLRSNVSLGTVNAAVSITDANAAEIVGRVVFSAGDWSDLINSRWAGLDNLNIPFKITGGSLYVAAVTAGSPTQSASGLLLNISLEIQQGLA